MEAINTPQGLAKSAENLLLIRKKRQAELTAKRVADRRKNTANLGVINWNEAQGMRFGKLVVIGLSRRNEKSVAYMMCKCDCGKDKEVCSSFLKNGDTQSCGCLHKAIMSGHKWNNIHGHSMRGKASKEYLTHRGMLARCHGMGHSRYSGRGIIVCDRWRFGEFGKTGFECFIKDMGNAPSKKHSIDRINNNGNYEQSNCRWATATQQGNNQHNTIKIEWNGEIKGVSEWANMFNMPRQLIYSRVVQLGWDIEMALFTPKLS